jgi:predicted small lipoprotein YifL
MLRRIAVLILVSLLAACGAKGPLYLPPAKPGTPPAPVVVPPSLPPPATSTGPADMDKKQP